MHGVDGVGGQHGRACPEDELVDAQSDDRGDKEDRHLHPTGHIVPVFENELHAGQVVEGQGDQEGYGAGQHVVEVDQDDQQIHDADIDDEGDGAHDAELDKLLDEFAHKAPLNHSPAAGPILPENCMQKSHDGRNRNGTGAC